MSTRVQIFLQDPGEGLHKNPDVGLLDLMVLFFFFVFLPFCRATPTAYGGSLARGQIRATAAGLHQSHSNLGSELCLQPTTQLTAMPDP